MFKGNKDRDSIAVGSFPHRIAARYLKFTPKFFHGKLMCMRVEAVGCHPDAGNVLVSFYRTLLDPHFVTQ